MFDITVISWHCVSLRGVVGLITSPWVRRYGVFKRIFLLLAVTALVVTMLAVGAGTALAQARHYECGDNAVGHLVETPGDDFSALRGKCILSL